MSQTRFGQWLLERAAEAASRYNSDRGKHQRDEILGSSPVRLAVTKCADGRVQIARALGVPPGVLFPIRSIGGKVEWGYPAVRAKLGRWMGHALPSGHEPLVLVTYHFSGSNPEWGCAGFGNDTLAATKNSLRLVTEAERIWPKGGPVAVVSAGFDTDFGALTVHGKPGTEPLSVGELPLGTTGEEIADRLQSILPGLRDSHLSGLSLYLARNVTRVHGVRARASAHGELEHKESGIALGGGFAWVDKRNRLVIIGHTKPDPEEDLAIAAELLVKNVMAGRVKKEDGLVLVTSAAYDSSYDAPHEARFAAAESRYLADSAMEILHRRSPTLADELEVLVGVTDLATQTFTLVKNL